MEKTSDSPANVAAIVISYNPEANLLENVHAVLQQVGQVIIVDNGSRSQGTLEQLSVYPGVTVIHNKSNLGIACALNQGMKWAISRGFEFVLTLDQDSRPMPGMVEKLLDVYRHADATQIAMVGPSIDDPIAGVKARHLRQRGFLSFELISCAQGLLRNVTFIITSGALCRVDVYQQIGPFHNELFIDYVDIEYSLRARKAGYEIIVNCDAQLIHRLGRRQKRVLLGRTEYPRFHPPLRWYYVARNRIQLLKQYFWYFPYWVVYEILSSTYGFARMLMLEDRRIEKIGAVLKGSWDGLRDRLGPA